MRQGRSSSFTGWPRELFTKEPKKSDEQWEVLRREEGALIVGRDGVEKELPLGPLRASAADGHAPSSVPRR
jgi:hypothetical protein